MIPCGPEWYRMVLYGLVWSCMVLYGPVWSFVVPQGPLYSCTVLYGQIWSCLAYYGPVGPCLHPYATYVCTNFVLVKLGSVASKIVSIEYTEDQLCFSPHQNPTCNDF